jgi:hypothetical protein
MIKMQFIPLEWLELSPFILCFSFETYIFPIHRKSDEQFSVSVVLSA